MLSIVTLPRRLTGFNTRTHACTMQLLLRTFSGLSGSARTIDPFNGAAFTATRLPLAEARTLPGHVFHSKQWYAAEVKHLLTPSWVLAGRADEITAPGSYIRVDMPDKTSALVVRGKDGRIRAWANVCRHRGARFEKGEMGKLKACLLVCPYHAWTFDATSGNLRGVPKGKGIALDKKDWSLHSIHLSEFGGFLFVTSGEETPPLETHLGNAPEIVFKNWAFEDFVTVGRREYLVDCNWKFLMQNTSETYHTAKVHRASLGPMTSESVEEFVGVSVRGNWNAVHVPGNRSVVPLPGEPAPFPELESLQRREDGLSTFFVSLFPTLQINITRDCAWWMRVLPEGPKRTRVTQGFLFPEATTMLPNFETLLQPYLHRWDMAVVEDNDVSVNQQHACESPYQHPGPYHNLEFAVHDFDNKVLDAVLRGEGEVKTADEESFAPDASNTKTQQATNKGASNTLSHSTTSIGQVPVRGRSSRSGAANALASNAPVCVTGANGFIALHLVEQLLRAGYRVTAAVRTNEAAKLAPLKSLGSLGELNIVLGCDLLAPGSFDTAVAESEVCFHTASPFWMDARITDPWTELVHPADIGTKNVLDACASESSKVRRVVLTSSFAAIMNVGGREAWPNDFEYTEEHWNVSSAPDKAGAFPDPVNGHAYRWSKTVAEKTAWDHTAVADGKFDLATILPPMVLGSNKQAISSLDDLNQSSLIIYNLMMGKMEHVMPGSVGFVDVADVAKAHLLAAQTPAAGGQRYLCSGNTKTWLEVVSMLRDLYPNAPLPTMCADGSTTQPCLHLKNDKIMTELGLEFVPLQQTLKAQCEALAAAGLLRL